MILWQRKIETSDQIEVRCAWPLKHVQVQIKTDICVLFTLQPKPPNPDWRYSASLRAGMQGYVLQQHFLAIVLL